MMIVKLAQISDTEYHDQNLAMIVKSKIKI